MSDARPRAVVVVHNRYRRAGGEERAVELHLRALERAGLPHTALVRRSDDAARLRAGVALLRGGEREREVAEAAAGARVVHFHNMQPLFGPRALAAARAAGARVVLHLHNFRLFCSIAVAFRDGEPCFRCRRRLTLPGAVLNCRVSLPESLAYATALSLHQPAVMRAVDRFATLSRYAAGQLVRLGVPADRLDVIPNYVPEDEVSDRSRADSGRYAAFAGRLTAEKGVAHAVDASALSGVPLRIAGSGPLERDLRARARAAGAPVELLGELPRAGVAELLAGAGMALVPSVGGDVMPFAALEAMAAGVPVVASRSGSLPEMVGPERCVPRGDPHALAAAMSALWRDPARRAADGDALIRRVRERYGEERYDRALGRLYALR